jgi:hypothetical protein
MESPERGALMLVRFTAAALIGWALAEVGLYLLVAQHNRQPVLILPCIIRSVPALVGIVMLIKAHSIARWLTDKLDL